MPSCIVLMWVSKSLSTEINASNGILFCGLSIRSKLVVTLVAAQIYSSVSCRLFQVCVALCIVQFPCQSWGESPNSCDCQWHGSLPFNDCNIECCFLLCQLCLCSVLMWVFVKRSVLTLVAQLATTSMLQLPTGCSSTRFAANKSFHIFFPQNT